MPRYHAQFSNGRSLTRRSERDYSHAWLLVWNDAGGRQHEKHGFSGNAQLAQKQLSLTPAPGRTLVHAEVVQAVRS